MNSRIIPFPKLNIIAEISANHGGSLNKAKELISAAKESGATAVKLQTFTAESITVQSDSFTIPATSQIWAGRNLWELMKEAETPLDWHGELFDYAYSIGIECLSTAYSIPAIAFLKSLGSKKLKISSFDLINTPLLQEAVKFPGLVILSTGMATLDEVRIAHEIFKEREEWVFMLCTSSYPCPQNEVNIRKIRTLQELAPVVGYSDHTKNSIAAVMAVALEVKYFEKHLVLDGDETLDSGFSLSPKEFALYVRDLHDAYLSLGSSSFYLMPNERASLWERPSIIALEDISIGDLMTEQNIGVRRPSVGDLPSNFYSLLSSKAKRSYRKGEGVFLNNETS